MSYYEQLNQFKTAMRIATTGEADDRKAYEKVTGLVGGEPLLGPYQIRSGEWAALAAAAGIEGARWQDGGAQEAVMNYQLTYLYNQLDGRWDGVAVAWRAGEKAADLIVKQGHPIQEVVKGTGAEELQLYVNDVIGAVDDTKVNPDEFVDAATYEGPFANAPLVDNRPRSVRSTRSPEDVVLGGLTKMRDQRMKEPMADLPPPAEPEPEPDVAGPLPEQEPA